MNEGMDYDQIDMCWWGLSIYVVRYRRDIISDMISSTRSRQKGKTYHIQGWTQERKRKKEKKKCWVVNAHWPSTTFDTKVLRNAKPNSSMLISTFHYLFLSFLSCFQAKSLVRVFVQIECLRRSEEAKSEELLRLQLEERIFLTWLYPT